MSTIGHNLTPEMIMFEWLKGIYETPSICTQAKVIATALYLRWDYQKNSADISYQEIASLTSQHINTVQKHCEKLKDFSLKFDPKKGKKTTVFSQDENFITHEMCNKSSNYTPHVQLDQINYTSGVQLEKRGVAPTGDSSSAYRGPLQQLPKTPVAPTPNPIIEPIIDPILSNSSLRSELESSENDFSDPSAIDQKNLEAKPKKKKSRKRIKYSVTFEEFWKAYPTDPNMSKMKAFEQWKKLDPTDQRQAKNATPIFVNYCRENSNYRPVHAERFLSQRRFDGFLDDSKQHYQPKPERKFFNRGKKSAVDQIRAIVGASNEDRGREMPETSSELDKKFETFWHYCPKKVNKPETKKMFVSIVKGTCPHAEKTIPEEIIEGMRYFNLAMNDTDDQYIKTPTAWLDESGWFNEYKGTTKYKWGWWRDHSSWLINEIVPKRLIENYGKHLSVCDVHWDWAYFGPPPGHPECLLSVAKPVDPVVQKKFEANLEKYKPFDRYESQVKSLISRFGFIEEDQKKPIDRYKTTLGTEGRMKNENPLLPWERYKKNDQAEELGLK